MSDLQQEDFETFAAYLKNRPTVILDKHVEQEGVVINNQSFEYNSIQQEEDPQVNAKKTKPQPSIAGSNNKSKYKSSNRDLTNNKRGRTASALNMQTGNSGKGADRSFNNEMGDEEYDNVSLNNSDIYYQNILNAANEAGMPKMNDEVFRKAMAYLQSKEARKDKLRSLS